MTWSTTQKTLAMAQLDPSRRQLEASKSHGTESSQNIKAPRAQTSPTFQQLIQGDSSPWSPISSPKLRKNNDHEEDHHNKKSVLMKVKERAKKLRHSFSGKKQHHDNNLSIDNPTPSWGVRLDDLEEEEEDPEYLGAPMYESELAPENYKETARQHPREVHGIPSEKHVITSSVKQVDEEEEQFHSPKQGEEEEHSFRNNKSITETVSDRLGPTYTAVSNTVSEKLAPAYAAVSDATHSVANKLASLTISTPEVTETGTSNTRSPQTWDKGVSVKEYLMQKFEPGEDEKALSQVISEKISPRRSPGDSGMVEKVKGAVSSFIWTEGSSQEKSQSTKATVDYQSQSISKSNASSPSLISTTKSNPSYESSISPTNTSTTKTKATSRASRSSTNASTVRTNSFPHTHVSARPADSKRSLSAHAPISTTTNAKSTSQTPSSTYITEVPKEGNHGRILQAN